MSFGAPMLHAIGYVYTNKAEQFSGSPLCYVSVEDICSPTPVVSSWAALEQKMHVVGTQIELGWAGLQAFLAAKAVAEAEQEEANMADAGAHKAEVMKMVADLLPNFVEARAGFWGVCQTVESLEPWVLRALPPSLPPCPLRRCGGTRCWTSRRPPATCAARCCGTSRRRRRRRS